MADDHCTGRKTVAGLWGTAIALSLIGSVSAQSASSESGAQMGDRRMSQPRSTGLPLPRDPDIAVKEEFEMAKSKGSESALDLFIRRHPEHPLALEAQRILDRLNGSEPKR